MKHTILRVALLALLLPASVSAQTFPPPPTNVDLGAVITNSLRTAGTVTSQQLTNTNSRGVVCRYQQTALSGSPSVTFGVQTFDAATNSYVTAASSGAITDGTATDVFVYPGASLTTTPSGWVVEALPLGPSWRVTQTVAGTAGPAVTGRIGCRLLD